MSKWRGISVTGDPHTSLGAWAPLLAFQCMKNLNTLASIAAAITKGAGDGEIFLGGLLERVRTFMGQKTQSLCLSIMMLLAIHRISTRVVTIMKYLHAILKCFKMLDGSSMNHEAVCLISDFVSLYIIVITVKIYCISRNIYVFLSKTLQLFLQISFFPCAPLMYNNTMVLALSWEWWIYLELLYINHWNCTSAHAIFWCIYKSIS